MLRNRMFPAALPLVLIAIASPFALSSCKDDSESTYKTGTGGGGGGGGSGEPVGVVNDDAGLYVKVMESDYYTASVNGDFVTPCTVKTDSVTKDIVCIVDANELDLKYFGVNFHYNVPSNMCTYLWRMHPYYYQYEAGTGPTTISYDQSNTGVISNVVVTPATGSVQSDGNPVCDYDYTPNGPNCCSGAYTLAANIQAADGTWAVQVSSGKWGGKESACFEGPAMESQPKTKDGYPYATISYVEGTGLNATYTVTAPLKKVFSSNVYAANYFSGATPTAVIYEYHDFVCADAAFEISARIRVAVREWNQKSELAEGATGDPDTTGLEPIGHPINDFRDWDDLEASLIYYTGVGG